MRIFPHNFPLKKVFLESNSLYVSRIYRIKETEERERQKREREHAKATTTTTHAPRHRDRARHRPLARDDFHLPRRVFLLLRIIIIREYDEWRRFRLRQRDARGLRVDARGARVERVRRVQKNLFGRKNIELEYYKA